MNAVVTRAGFLTSVQDLGRTGFRQFGVSTSGALDPFALRVANLLVGNDEGAAGLEITLGGLQLRFEDERIVAWCGGEFDVQIGSRALPAGHVAHLQRGDELKFGRAQIGCRCWLAISGGIDVPVVLGSRSTDLRANFGGIEGRALRDGDVVPLARRPGSSAFAKATADKSPRLQEFPRGPHHTIGQARQAATRICVSSVAWIGIASTIQRFNDSRITNSASHQIRIVWVSALMVRN